MFILLLLGIYELQELNFFILGLDNLKLKGWSFLVAIFRLINEKLCFFFFYFLMCYKK